MRLCLAFLPLLVLPLVVTGYQNGPIPGVTGGFGEPSCAQCHAGKPATDRALTIAVPKSYRAGEVYQVRVTLARPGLEIGGFEVSARFDSGLERGRQAGVLRARDERTQVVAAKGLQYAQHTEAGSRAIKNGTLSWVVDWTAPATGSGDVIFHVAANASNADLSALGDTVYTSEATSRPDRTALGS